MKDKWLKGTVILTVTALLSKILSMLYKVPYQNRIGDAGLYAFQQVYPLLGIYTVLSSVVLPSIISELLLTHQYNEQVKSQIKRLLWIFSVSAFALLFLGSDLIARLMGDRSLGAAIRWVGMAYLLLPHVSYLRGVFLTRSETMARAGISITIEQLVRVLMILLAVGQFGHLHVSRIAEMAYLLGLAGPVAGILYLGAFKQGDEPQQFIRKKFRLRFIRKTGYLFLSAGILTIFQLIDSFVVFNSLLVGGLGNLEAMVQKGVFDRGFPIVQAATFFIGAIVSSTLPQLVGAENEKQKKQVFNYSLFLVILLSVPGTVGLYLVMGSLNTALFEDMLGTGTLQIMSLQVLFFPFIVLTAAVLQQEERYGDMVVSVLAGIFIKLIATPLLTESMGIYGAALSSVLALGVIALINLVKFRRMLVRQSFYNLLKVGFATLCMWLAVDTLRTILPGVLESVSGRTGHVLTLAILTLAGVLAYGLVMLLFILTTQTKADLSKKRRRKKQATRKRARKTT
ncbi:MAG: oligosaccharide flippase family protein [Turicibacter sp.]|nr:oligosaccharide flippase family protein [Turicibacter sp.]